MSNSGRNRLRGAQGWPAIATFLHSHQCALLSYNQTKRNLIPNGISSTADKKRTLLATLNHLRRWRKSDSIAHIAQMLTNHSLDFLREEKEHQCFQGVRNQNRASEILGDQGHGS